jgi:catechol 2,3-dioxygenase-like lactoylglutathione lyase family enzyme
MLRAMIPAALLAVSAFAQPTARLSPNLVGIAHVAIRVRDLDASVAFYKKLGFLEPFALSRDGKVYEAFLKINDHQFIELYPATEKQPQIGFLHVCFEGDNLQALHDYYASKGLTPTDVKTAGAGNLLFTMQGPMTLTGPQNLEYTQYMPGSMHWKDFGKDLGPDRIAERMYGVTVVVNDPIAARAFYVDKLGFDTMKLHLLLPSQQAGGEILLQPTRPLGLKARLLFVVKSISEAAASLRQRGVPFTKDVVSDISLSDPDGNEILLIGPHVE